MMKAEVKVPPMGESITEATVSTIIKKSGSQVNVDDEIIELETDKVNQVLYAPKDGLLTLSVNVGDKVTIDQVLGFVDTESKSSSVENKNDEQGIDKHQEEPSKNVEKHLNDDRTKHEKELFLSENKTESKTRISKEDFAKSLNHKSEEKNKDEKNLPQEKEAPLKLTSFRGETARPMSNIRKVIASRMVDVKNTTAMLTTFNEVDMSAVMALREKYKDQFTEKNGVKLGFMSFFVKASVSALKAFPDINSYIAGDEIVHREYYDIGVAVGTDRGVIVPVVRDCDHLNYAEIELAIEQFSKKARGGTISIDDLQGGGFTITNGGVYGSMLSTPIVSPNQSAILGLHKISKRAVVVNDEIVIRPIMYLALSYDHRIVDGKEAVSFLVHIKDFLEYPGASLLGL